MQICSRWLRWALGCLKALRMMRSRLRVSGHCFGHQAAFPTRFPRPKKRSELCSEQLRHHWRRSQRHGRLHLRGRVYPVWSPSSLAQQGFRHSGVHYWVLIMKESYYLGSLIFVSPQKTQDTEFKAPPLKSAKSVLGHLRARFAPTC